MLHIWGKVLPPGEAKIFLLSNFFWYCLHVFLTGQPFSCLSPCQASPIGNYILRKHEDNISWKLPTKKKLTLKSVWMHGKLKVQQTWSTGKTCFNLTLTSIQSFVTRRSLQICAKQSIIITSEFIFQPLAVSRLVERNKIFLWCDLLWSWKLFWGK